MVKYLNFHNYSFALRYTHPLFWNLGSYGIESVRKVGNWIFPCFFVLLLKACNQWQEGNPWDFLKFLTTKAVGHKSGLFESLSFREPVKYPKVMFVSFSQFQTKGHRCRGLMSCGLFRRISHFACSFVTAGWMKERHGDVFLSFFLSFLLSLKEPPLSSTLEWMCIYQPFQLEFWDQLDDSF